MAKERRQARESEVKNTKPISWYADPKDRHAVDEIKMAEEFRDGRPCGSTHVITMAVRAFAQLYKANPNHALEMARTNAKSA